MLTLGFGRLFRGPQSRLEHIVILIIGMPKRDNSFPAQVWGSSYSCGVHRSGLAVWELQRGCCRAPTVAPKFTSYLKRQNGSNAS